MQQSVSIQKSEKSKRQTAEIRLLGQKISLKSSQEDPELVDEIVELVAVLLRNAELRTRSKVPHEVAVLALLDLAEEYLNAKRRTVAFKRKMNDKSQQLVGLLEAELR